MEKDKLLFWPALIVKLLPAFLMGIVMATIFREKALDQAPMAAAFTAYLFCWPVMVLWDNLVSEEWIAYRPGFFALYLAYIVTYFFAARLGVMLALRSPAIKIPKEALGRIDANHIIATAATTVVTTAATGAITWAMTMTS